MGSGTVIGYVTGSTAVYGVVASLFFILGLRKASSLLTFIPYLDSNIAIISMKLPPPTCSFSFGAITTSFSFSGTVLPAPRFNMTLFFFFGPAVTTVAATTVVVEVVAATVETLLAGSDVVVFETTRSSGFCPASYYPMDLRCSSPTLIFILFLGPAVTTVAATSVVAEVVAVTVGTLLAGSEVVVFETTRSSGFCSATYYPMDLHCSSPTLIVILFLGPAVTTVAAVAAVTELVAVVAATAVTLLLGYEVLVFYGTSC